MCKVTGLVVAALAQRIGRYLDHKITTSQRPRRLGLAVRCDKRDRHAPTSNCGSDPQSPHATNLCGPIDLLRILLRHPR